MTLGNARPTAWSPGIFDITDLSARSKASLELVPASVLKSLARECTGIEIDECAFDGGAADVDAPAKEVLFIRIPHCEVCPRSLLNNPIITPNMDSMIPNS